MIEFELDGKQVSAQPGSNILEVALKEGKYIPHFCYHKKLSIAANCRMCLVEVEKAPKPLPACATPIAPGMKVQTASKMAVEAQKGVMEFLLINHPLDCPVCDQGGECQLQDLSVGYGKSATRFHEEKRAVSNKDLGPLVRTVMTRCIHCSRCVRFTDEIAGYQELGMNYRNNHVEVTPFLGKTVDSELSGNIIDICPVGALTSKPYQDTGRPWELSRRKTISAHDALGSNLIAQVDKYHKVARVLPFENEQINECWISDRDRFAYLGLYHNERVSSPMVKQDNKWIQTSWEAALKYVGETLNKIKAAHGSNSIAVLGSASSTTEELYLLQKAMRDFGVQNIDSRMEQVDFSLDAKQVAASYLGMSIEEFAKQESVLLVGCDLRNEQPLLAQRLRQSAKKGTEVSQINPVKFDLLMPTLVDSLVDPRNIAYKLAQVLFSVVAISGKTTTVDLSNVKECSKAVKIANSLIAKQGIVAIGRLAKTSSDYSLIVKLANEITRLVDGKVSMIASLANEVGAQLVGFNPYGTSFFAVKPTAGNNAKDMLSKTHRAYVLLNTEIEADAYNPVEAIETLKKADSVVAITAYASKEMLEYADVILPVSVFTETAGSFVNIEGKLQTFNGVTKPLGDAKPAWKVIRVLANNLGLSGFEYENIEDVRKELATLNDASSLLNNSVNVEQLVVAPKHAADSLVRLGSINIYNTDSIVRRSEALQATKIAQPKVSISLSLAEKLGLQDGDMSNVTQSGVSAEFKVHVCHKLTDNVVSLSRRATGHMMAGLNSAIEISAVKG